MAKITVVNKKTYTPGPHDFYIGRGSALGNPYTSMPLMMTKAKFQCSSVEEAIASYERYFNCKMIGHDREMVAELMKIQEAYESGHDVQLVCFCSPRPCHGNVIKSFIEGVVEKIKNGEV